MLGKNAEWLIQMGWNSSWRYDSQFSSLISIELFIYFVKTCIWNFSGIFFFFVIVYYTEWHKKSGTLEMRSGNQVKLPSVLYFYIIAVIYRIWNPIVWDDYREKQLGEVAIITKLMFFNLSHSSNRTRVDEHRQVLECNFVIVGTLVGT